MDLLVNFSQ